MSIAHVMQDEEIILVADDDGEELTVRDVNPLTAVTVGALPEVVMVEEVTSKRSCLCIGCGRPPGHVIAAGAKSEWGMATRWCVNQLRKFLQCYMAPDEARQVALRFSEIVVEE